MLTNIWQAICLLTPYIKTEGQWYAVHFSAKRHSMIIHRQDRQQNRTGLSLYSCRESVRSQHCRCGKCTKITVYSNKSFHRTVLCAWTWNVHWNLHALSVWVGLECINFDLCWPHEQVKLLCTTHRWRAYQIAHRLPSFVLIFDQVHIWWPRMALGDVLGCDHKLRFSHIVIFLHGRGTSRHMWLVLIVTYT